MPLCVNPGAARNAGLLAVQILATAAAALRQKLEQFKEKLAAESRAKNKTLGG